MDKVIMEKKAISSDRWDEIEDVIEVVYGGDRSAFLDNLLKAMGDDELDENLEYIKRVNDYDSIKQEMNEGSDDHSLNPNPEDGDDGW